MQHFSTDFADDDEVVTDVFRADMAGVVLAFIKSSPDCVKLLNREGRISFLSRNGACAMELDSPYDVVGRTWWQLWPEEMRSALETGFRQALDGELVRLSGECPTAKGVMKRWDVTISPVRNDDWTIDSVLAVSREVG